MAEGGMDPETLCRLDALIHACSSYVENDSPDATDSYSAAASKTEQNKIPKNHTTIKQETQESDRSEAVQFPKEISKSELEQCLKAAASKTEQNKNPKNQTIKEETIESDCSEVVQCAKDISRCALEMGIGAAASKTEQNKNPKNQTIKEETIESDCSEVVQCAKDISRCALEMGIGAAASKTEQNKNPKNQTIKEETIETDCSEVVQCAKDISRCALEMGIGAAASKTEQKNKPKNRTTIKQESQESDCSEADQFAKEISRCELELCLALEGSIETILPIVKEENVAQCDKGDQVESSICSAQVCETSRSSSSFEKVSSVRSDEESNECDKCDPSVPEKESSPKESAILSPVFIPEHIKENTTDAVNTILENGNSVRGVIIVLEKVEPMLNDIDNIKCKLRTDFENNYKKLQKFNDAVENVSEAADRFKPLVLNELELDTNFLKTVIRKTVIRNDSFNEEINELKQIIELISSKCVILLEFLKKRSGIVFGLNKSISKLYKILEKIKDNIMIYEIVLKAYGEKK